MTHQQQRSPGDGAQRASDPRVASGYTLIQLLIVLLIIGVLVVAFGYGSVGSTDAAKASVAKQFLTTDMPQAIFAYADLTSDVSTAASNAELKDQLIARGANPETAWGGTWNAAVVPSVNVGGHRVQVRYRMGGADPSGYAGDLARSLSSGQYSFISEVRNSGGELRIFYNTPSSPN